ncbi:MAG: ATPase [Candidatus Nealsonbacteria bacterium]|nr:ATPase [Candidatus Nealsonbacteria bacterium]
MASTDADSSRAQIIAIPLAGGQLCAHFGHCEQFALLDVDTAGSEILGTRHLTPPPHEPGLLPRWLHEQGVNLIIAGGMGQRAQNIFAEQNIRVVVGVGAGSPESVVRAYLDGKLQSGENLCDH